MLEIPARLAPEAEWLYGQVFTNRPDSPAWLIRFAESREYSCFGRQVTPKDCLPRTRGSITVDNDGYGRYSGEVQLIRSDLPADGRVNVVGQVETPWLLLTDCVSRGAKFVLTRD